MNATAKIGLFALAVLLVLEHPEPGGGDSGGGQQLLHEGLGALEPGTVGTGSEHAHALGPEPVRQPVDEWLLGADHHQVHRSIGDKFLNRHRRRAGDPGVAGSHHDLGGPPQNLGQSVLSAARTDDDDLHRDAAPRCTNCSRPGPTPTRVTGTPTWLSRNAR